MLLSSQHYGTVPALQLQAGRVRTARGFVQVDGGKKKLWLSCTLTLQEPMGCSAPVHLLSLACTALDSFPPANSRNRGACLDPRPACACCCCSPGTRNNDKAKIERPDHAASLVLELSTRKTEKSKPLARERLKRSNFRGGDAMAGPVVSSWFLCDS